MTDNDSDNRIARRWRVDENASAHIAFLAELLEAELGALLVADGVRSSEETAYRYAQVLADSVLANFRLIRRSSDEPYGRWVSADE